jgi:hypothetical protein
VVHDHERIDPGLEKWFAVSISGFLLQTAAAGIGFLGGQPLASLEQGHLGGEMASFTDFHHGATGEALGGQEADVIAASVTAGTDQPEGRGFDGCRHCENRPM